MSRYGTAPEVVGVFDLADWQEYMHYMYLPVAMMSDVRLPERLAFAADLIHVCRDIEAARGNHWTYVYLTVRRGFATPGNPLNRPGWHADGFGTPDINYVWTDRFPTLFAIQEFENISEDHVESGKQFDKQVVDPLVQTFRERSLLRLDPFVVHAAPEVPAPGGERGFLKVSFSNDRYNLRGNSHNHLFDYDWKMWSRDEVRNDPAYAGGDIGPQEGAA